MLIKFLSSVVRPSRVMVSARKSLLSIAIAGCASFSPYLANASTLGFDIVSSSRDISFTDTAFTTDDEADGVSFKREFTAHSLDASGVLDPLDYLAEILGIEPLIGNDVTNTTGVGFSNRVRLVGDVGAKAIVQGFASIGGLWGHIVDALPSGDARSHVEMQIKIEHVSGTSLVQSYLSTNKNSNNEIIFNASGDLSSESTHGSEFLAVVGDEFIIEGYFESVSRSNIDEQCIPKPIVGGCLFYIPGIGAAASYTLGDGTVSLTATAVDEPLAPVPLPASFLMFASSLAGLGALRRRMKEASS